ncbi:hypothetical protein SOCE26_004000 [Sorangium cellulosum]|uniref:Secreted protein n=2 Tax=Sorangium cellulosum TaxID=56 RepID=A0A2L0EI93_SORCE|nr:hypothetical protein SOCE26_004000 [Sorangium cellulosum]
MNKTMVSACFVMMALGTACRISLDPIGGAGAGENAPEDGGDGGAGPGSSTTTSSSGGGTDAPDPAVDLFACGFELSCQQFYHHAYTHLTDALPCAARLLVGGGTGVLSSLLSIGPYVDETESVMFVLGDGTALVQTREKHCGRPGMECGPPPGWDAPSQHQICDLEVSPEVEEACATDGEGCSWSPWPGLTNCRAAEEHTCEQVAMRLEAP